MRYESFRFLFRQLLFQPRDIPVVLGRKTILAAKQGTEGAMTFKTDHVANISDTDPFPGQQEFGCF